MHATSLVFAMAALVVLTATVLVNVFMRRVRAVRQGKVKATYFKTMQGEAPPDDAVNASRHFTNLFEAPVLFYAACLAAMVLHIDGIAIHVLAWLYVGARIVHAAIHLGPNKLWPRIYVYMGSWLVLVALWGVVVVAAYRS